MEDNMEDNTPENKQVKTCMKCGDTLKGHEDDSDTHCRWCVTGWIACDECESVETA
jgi:hypothetical protein